MNDIVAKLVLTELALYVLQWDTTHWISGREAPVYESVLWSTVVLSDPWSEERLSGEPRQELQASQTHHCSTQLSGEEHWSVTHIHVWAPPGLWACITKQEQKQELLVWTVVLVSAAREEKKLDEKELLPQVKAVIANRQGVSVVNHHLCVC